MLLAIFDYLFYDYWPPMPPFFATSDYKSIDYPSLTKHYDLNQLKELASKNNYKTSFSGGSLEIYTDTWLIEIYSDSNPNSRSIFTVRGGKCVQPNLYLYYSLRRSLTNLGIETESIKLRSIRSHYSIPGGGGFMSL